ncbi:MAG TPA: DUF192 domain-containing protein [Candidatus Dormibacteraeota bacterium]|nr:DUF192 domain-containing protein [Candidatus Dormibacteraeota bacterium]
MKKLLLATAILITCAVLLLIYMNSSRIHTLPLTSVEIADTEKERNRGLMGRNELCRSCGMLFVYNNEAVRTFWMKDTPISLDIIFIDGSGKVVRVAKNVQPNSEVSISSGKPVQYVLEVNTGMSDEYGLRVGQKIDINSLLIDSP